MSYREDMRQEQRDRIISARIDREWRSTTPMKLVEANPHTAQIDTQLHRAPVMPDDCAPEGGIPPGHWRENQGRPIAKAPRPPRVPRQRPHLIGPLLGVLSILAVAAGSALALWGGK